MGLLGVVVHLSLFLLLTRGLEVPYLVATALAVEAAVLHNFLWHERWTWLDRSRLAPAGVWARLVRFNLATGGVSIAGNLILMRLFAGALHLPPALAALVSIASCWLLNFLAADRLVFTKIESTRRARHSMVPVAVAQLVGDTVGQPASKHRPSRVWEAQDRRPLAEANVAAGYILEADAAETVRLTVESRIER